MWPIDLETGAVKPVTASAFYGLAGCSGAEYVNVVAVPAGYAFEVGTGGSTRVRDNATQAIDRSILAQQFATCSNAAMPYPRTLSVPMTSTRAVTRPAAPFTGPLHVEIR